jgi:hypothetical protein
MFEAEACLFSKTETLFYSIDIISYLMHAQSVFLFMHGIVKCNKNKMFQIFF